MIARYALALAAILLGAVTAPESHGQSASGAQSTYIDPSIANSGMGKAGVAVFWHDVPNDWENPALLGSINGVHFLYGRTQLVPELADDVYFTSKRLTIGGLGLGVSMSGKPFEAIGESRLDYGESQSVDDQGNVIGTFHAYEKIRHIGVGLNVLESVETAFRALGKSAPNLSRLVDLSVGHTWKTVRVDLAPAYATLDGSSGHGEAKERDRGALLRITPLDQIHDAGTSRSGGRLRLDTAAGFSQRNYTDHRISHVDQDQSQAITEERLVGFAARATLEFPGERRGVIWNFIAPSISLGATLEEARYYDGGVRDSYETISRTGQELVVAELLFLRHGYIDDPTGTIQGDTWGVGAQVRFRNVIGIQYDFARVPQSKFLGSVDRHGVTVSVAPDRLWEQLR